MESLAVLEYRADWVRKETLKLHKLAPETRLASSLSDIEIFVALYYTGLLRYDPKDAWAEERDRFFVSKGHGAISLYPILADRGFFSLDQLQSIGNPDSLLGVIPDARVPGFESINGALGHGLGVACGSALALKRKGSEATVFVLVGDGELNEGSNWEAVMFGAYHKLDNVILIVDDNEMSMLGYQRDILGVDSLEEKFNAFGWQAKALPGHDMEQLCATLSHFKQENNGQPKVLVANTLKGRGVPVLVGDPLNHVKSLKPEEVDKILEEWEQGQSR